MITNLIIAPKDDDQHEMITTFEQKFIHFLNTILEFTSIHYDISNLVHETTDQLQTLTLINTIDTIMVQQRSKYVQEMNTFVKNTLNKERFSWPLFLLYIITRNLGKISNTTDYALRSRNWIDEFRLSDLVIQTLKEFNLDDALATQTLYLYKILVYNQQWFEDKTGVFKIEHKTIENILKNPETQQFLQVNRFNDILWFNKERFELLVTWFLLIAVLDALAAKDLGKRAIKQHIAVLYKTVLSWLEAEKKSNYQIQNLLDLLTKDERV